MNSIELIDDLIEKVETLKVGEDTWLDALKRRIAMIIRNIFGESSRYLNDLDNIMFYAPVESLGYDIWNMGRTQLLNLLYTMKDEVKLFGLTAKSAQNSAQVDKAISDRIFIVHGHDDAMKQAVSRTIEKLGLNPIILHEQPNKGSNSIIEKFTKYANVSFAIVLLSPDDLAYSKGESPGQAKSRARQNVILELGFFLGRLGRERVLSLYREEKNFEMPSDYSGVLFVPFDLAGRWQFDLIKELKASGYDVDANALV